MKKFYKCSFAILAFLFSISISAQRIPGILVLNEGNFGQDNAGISFIGDGQVHASLYADVNDPYTLGNTAQSMAFEGDKAYVVLNGSGSLTVLNRYTLEFSAITTIGINPRHIIINNGTAYVTCWGDPGDPTDDYVAEVHLLSMSVIRRIPVPEGPERIIQSGDYLYVAHQGGYGYGNTVSVINMATNDVSTTINTGDVPNSVIAQDGVLYVLCGGKPSWTGSPTSGKLMKFNLSDNSLISEITFEGKNPSNLEIYGDYLLFAIDENVYKITLNDTALPETPLFSLAEVGVYGVYGMDIIGDKIYVGDAKDYVSPGQALIYTMNGVLEATYTVGPLPNSFYEGEIQFLSTQNSQEIAAIAVYPNPTAERFFINTDQQANIKMYDISGRLVRSTVYNASGVEVSDLVKGVYLVEISINDQKSVKRLSIK